MKNFLVYPWFEQSWREYTISSSFSFSPKLISKAFIVNASFWYSSYLLFISCSFYFHSVFSVLSELYIFISCMKNWIQCIFQRIRSSLFLSSFAKYFPLIPSLLLYWAKNIYLYLFSMLLLCIFFWHFFFWILLKISLKFYLSIFKCLFYTSENIDFLSFSID